MQIINHTYGTLYSELAQRTLDDRFVSEFAIEGRFITQEVKGRRYWYFDTAKPEGGKARTYVGRVDDEEINSRVERFKDLKADHKTRRKLVGTLVREAYFPQPEALAGDIVEALAEAGFFRLRGVLIGTVAFQCYTALLGVRLSNVIMQTGDADFAQFHSISVDLEDSLPPVLQTLRAVDDTFREIPHPFDGRYSTTFQARSGYKVEFLTPNTGSAEHDGRPTHMPALGGAAAQPLRFLDYLIHEPVRAVMLHGAGVPVLVPAPERYAIHKLIVGSRRRLDNDGTAKASKDRLQAITLMEAMTEVRQSGALASAYMEAWERGPAWRDAIAESLDTLDPRRWEAVREGLARQVTRQGGEPELYGLGQESA